MATASKFKVQTKEATLVARDGTIVVEHQSATSSKYAKKFANQFNHLKTKYAQINQLLSRMIAGTSTYPLIISGPPGVGKTHAITSFITAGGHKGKVTTINSKVTPLGLYGALYGSRRKGDILILDDCDSALEDTDSLNMLKAATDTYAVRTINWISSRKNGGLPDSFTTEGTVIILTNKDIGNVAAKTTNVKAEHLAAIYSRGYKVELSKDTLLDKFIQTCYCIYNGTLLSGMSDKEKDQVVEYIDSRLLKVSGTPFKTFDLRTALQIKDQMEFSDDWRVACDMLL